MADAGGPGDGHSRSPNDAEKKAAKAKKEKKDRVTRRKLYDEAADEDELLALMGDLTLKDPSVSAAPPLSMQPVHPPGFEDSLALAVASIRRITDAKNALRASAPDPALYPIVKLVAISITHGSSIGEMNCPALPYATHDFRKVFFFGNAAENICFNDDRFSELFASRKKPFKPNDETLRLLLGMDRPKCRYEDPNVYLPPMVFTLEPSDTSPFHEHNLMRKHLMGLYLYIIRRSPTDQTLFIQKLKVANYDDLDKDIYITYSIIFGRFHRYIKANAELVSYMRQVPNPLTVGFFCCRGAHLRQLYNPTLAAITNPHTCLPPLPIISVLSTSGGSFSRTAFPRLFLHIMSPDYTLESLHQGRQPLLRRGMRNVTWQSCLYNLFFFFNIISRESADALTSVASSQQVRQLSTNVILVSGESPQEAIRILNGLIPPTIYREYIVQRLPILLGIHKIMSVLTTLTFNNTYVVFAKVYPAEFVPTAPSIPSQMGHWVAIARFRDHRYYYVDVQTGQYITIMDVNAMPDLFAPYVVMDLLYILTEFPYFHGPDVLNMQLPQLEQPRLEPPPPPPPPSSSSDSDGGRMRRRVMSKKRKFKSKMKTRTNRRAVK
jgi:hypothetical protein